MDEETFDAGPSLRDALEVSAQPVLLTGADGVVTYANPPAGAAFACDRAALVGTPVDRVLEGAHAAAAAWRPGPGPALELTARRTDGSEFPVEVSLTVVGGHTIHTLRDISLRKRVVAELDGQIRRRAVVAELGQVALILRREDELFERALSSISDALGMEMVGVSEITEDQRNLVLRRSHGWGLETDVERLMAIAGTQSGWTLEHGTTVIADLAAETRFPTDALRSFGVTSGIAVPLTVEGAPVGVLSAFSREPHEIRDDDVAFVGTVANVLAAALARRRAEAALERSSTQLQAVLDNTPTAIYLKDHPGGRYLVVNASTARTAGVEVEAMLDHTDEQLFARDVVDHLRGHDHVVAATRTSHEFVERLGGRVFRSVKFPLLDEAGEVRGVGGVSLDITEQVRLEDRLRRSERLESIGQLAGGIAHDFNNLLAVIANFAGFVAAEVPEGSRLADDVQQILTATDRAGELTRRLLQFSRRQPSRPEVLDAGAIVAEVERLLERTLGEHIAVRTASEEGLWRVVADRGQLEQVLMNLALNARDAMPGGGVLRIEVRNERPGFAPQDPDGVPREGRFVRLTVADTGAGMTADVAARALEPFFTTKPSGAGTGLGLSSVYGIVTQAGGALDVESAAGQGTTVTVWLPGTETPAAATAPDGGAPAAPGTGQPVLVVEDQPGVREVARRILSDHGYAVVTAEDSEQALRAVDDHRLVPAVLVTDVLMPGLSGPDLAQALRRRMPALPVVFVSGFPEVAQPTRGAAGPPTLFVEKPFRAARLLEAVGEALGSR